MFKGSVKVIKILDSVQYLVSQLEEQTSTTGSFLCAAMSV